MGSPEKICEYCDTQERDGAPICATKGDADRCINNPRPPKYASGGVVDRPTTLPNVSFVGEPPAAPPIVLGLVSSSSFCVQEQGAEDGRSKKRDPLPAPAPLWMRLPIIRHIRVALVRFDMWYYYSWRRKHGVNIRCNAYDYRCLRAICQGKI